jgi:hypothetical protein
MTRGYRYLLGDSPGEAVRLRAQARLWDPLAFALFDRLKVRPGWKVLEVGPGQGSLHVELRRRLRGPLDAVERYAALPPFSRAKAKGLRKELLAAARRKDSLLIAPAVLSVVGWKKA